MIIFSERINGMYRDVRTAIQERDKQLIQDLAREQVAGGAIFGAGIVANTIVAITV